jgi:hypothetical protein
MNLAAKLKSLSSLFNRSLRSLFKLFNRSTSCRSDEAPSSSSPEATRGRKEVGENDLIGGEAG